MSYGQSHTDPEDMFSDTRMSFGDHLEELRLHLWRAIIGFGLILLLTLILDAVGYVTDTPIGIGKPVMEFMIKPVEDALLKFYAKRLEKVTNDLETGKTYAEEANERRKEVIWVDINELKKQLGLHVEDGEEEYVPIKTEFRPLTRTIAQQKAQMLVGRRPSVSTLSPTEAMVVYFKVAIVCGIVLGSPWIFWQIWSFIASGLYPHEKKYVNIYLPFSIALFLGGVLVCEFLVIPRALEALFFFNEWLGLEPDLRLNEWLSFAIWLPIIFGGSFQTPLVMLFLERIGVISIEGFQAKRRLSWFVMAVFTAIITPTPDAITMLMMWLPMCGLYELGIFLCKLSPRPRDLDIDVPDSQEMVEV